MRACWELDLEENYKLGLRLGWKKSLTKCLRIQSHSLQVTEHLSLVWLTCTASQGWMEIGVRAAVSRLYFPVGRAILAAIPHPQDLWQVTGYSCSNGPGCE